MLAACGSDDPGSPGPGTGGAIAATGGAGGLVASGGAPSGGAITGGATSTGGATIVPAALGECFAPVPSAPQTCRGYCEGKGKTCVQKGCLPDGTAAASGYTWLTFDKAQCPASQIPELVSFDSCAAPFELSREIPDNQLVRCCCSS
jgi:hypothetical protein